MSPKVNSRKPNLSILETSHFFLYFSKPLHSSIHYYVLFNTFNIYSIEIEKKKQTRLLKFYFSSVISLLCNLNATGFSIKTNSLK